MKDIEEKAYIFGTIFTLSNRLQILGDRMDTRITVKQWLLLAGVLRCPNNMPTLGEVAECIGSSRQNVKKMALILEKQGFILMEKDEKDARILRIRLTDECRAYLKQREEMEMNFIEELFFEFDSVDLLALARTIRKLEKNVNKMGKKYGEEEV